MADKKDPGKFTVRFNVHDPQHQTVVALLNRQGRNKAQFLASAVLHYINCKETPNLQTPPIDPETLEKTIVSILEKRTNKSAAAMLRKKQKAYARSILRRSHRPRKSRKTGSAVPVKYLPFWIP